MKIAVPVKSNGEIDAHFGHCAHYQLFTIADNKEILKIEQIESPQGCGCKSNIASVLEQLDVQVMLAGGIGDGAVNKLNSHHIQTIRNCSGYAADQVALYLNGELNDGGTNCSAHEHGHSCNHDH